MCYRSKLKVNVGLGKAVVFQRARKQTIDFAEPYRVKGKCRTEYKIWLWDERVEGVIEIRLTTSINNCITC